MKHSPLCSRDDGREVFFTVKSDAGSKFRVTFAVAILDKELGADATEKARKSWVKTQLPATLTMIAQYPTTGPDPVPSLTPKIEEIS
ncbi:MAG: hypothetical protein AAF386_01345 [Pseudomonadota bacterium]